MSGAETDTGLVLVGRIMPASNATFLGEIDGRKVVYKPVAGERPLWDFPDATLAHREVAAHLVSEATGWQVVPPTWLGDGPHGPGMLQEWREPDPDQAPVDVVPAGTAPDHVRSVLQAEDGRGRPVTLVHEDTEALRRMAVLDLVLNNADRKGGHVLAMADGHRFGVDHGLCFHVEPKLRTVLWGWAGEPLGEADRAGVRRVLDGIDSRLGAELAPLLGRDEVEVLAARCRDLLDAGHFPEPPRDRAAIPWPAF